MFERKTSEVKMRKERTGARSLAEAGAAHPHPSPTLPASDGLARGWRDPGGRKTLRGVPSRPRTPQASRFWKGHSFQSTGNSSGTSLLCEPPSQGRGSRRTHHEGGRAAEGCCPPGLLPLWLICPLRSEGLASPGPLRDRQRALLPKGPWKCLADSGLFF